MSNAATRFCIASIKVRYSRSETGTLAPRSSAKNEKNIATAESGRRPSPRPSPRKRDEGAAAEKPLAPCKRGEGGARRGGGGGAASDGTSPSDSPALAAV